MGGRGGWSDGGVSLNGLSALLNQEWGLAGVGRAEVDGQGWDQRVMEHDARQKYRRPDGCNT
jgi:hypothetical protein